MKDFKAFLELGDIKDPKRIEAGNSILKGLVKDIQKKTRTLERK